MKPNTAPSPLIAPRMIWIALVVSIHIYVAVIYFVRGRLETDAAGWLPDFTDRMQLGLTVVAGVIFAAAFTLPRKLATRVATHTLSEADETPETGERRIIAQTFPAYLARIAMAESVMICGFVIAFVHGGPEKVLPFYVASLLIFLISFPASARKLRTDYPD